MNFPLSKPAPQRLAALPASDSECDISDEWAKQNELDENATCTAHFVARSEEYCTNNPYEDGSYDRHELLCIEVTDGDETYIYTPETAAILLGNEAIAAIEERQTETENGW